MVTDERPSWPPVGEFVKVALVFPLFLLPIVLLQSRDVRVLAIIYGFVAVATGIVVAVLHWFNEIRGRQ